MHATPLATVIVLSYNSPDLFATLRSVLEQDYPRLQLIVTDDGSEDFCRETVERFIRKYGAENLESAEILVNRENLGTVRTLNMGLMHSKGEYIFNLAGDDCFYDSRVICDWVEAFQTTGAQVMTALREIYDEQLLNPLRTEPTQEQIRKVREFTTEELFEELAATNFIFGCCTARTARSIEKYGLFDEQYRLIEDHPMNLRLLRMGERTVFFDRIVVKYRSGGASSPARYNAIYAQDVDCILRSEVLPYTKHQRRVRWDYYQWKRDQKLLLRRAQMLTNHSSRPMFLLIQIWYYLHHPWRTLRRLPARFLRKLKGD
jgi:glycosyltransferase involved in cell wall biosynthesis